MLIFYDNLIDYSGVSISAVSANSLLPVANVANSLRKKVYRTGTSVAAEVVTFDLGSAKAVTSLILLDHTLTAADTLLKVEGSADNFATTGFTQTLTWASGTILQTFSTQTYRYWRVKFTKSAAGQTRDIGRIFLGPYYAATEQPDYSGADIEQTDPSKTTMSAGGQEYTDIKEKFDILALKFSTSPNSQVATFQTLYNTVGISIPFFVQIDTATPFDKVYYVKFAAALKRGVAAYDGAYFWNTALNLKEQI